jgi:drug/metabolite transporter (DMT)-like permease
VLCFSVTFPATTAAEASFSPVLVGVGRSVIGATLALAVLAARRERLLPPRVALRGLLVVALTVGVGFGLLSALALRDVSSVHGAVLTGLIPAATAGMAVLRAGERPRPGYWAALGLGLAVVIGFALIQGGGRLSGADALLLVAIAVGGVGYAEGGILARQYGGWRVICWALVISLPVTLPVTLAAALVSPPRHVSAGSALALAYVGLVSMCLGFFAWYQGLARGGLARIGRLQLAQPALTLGWSALLLGERVSWLTAVAAAAVIAVTAAGRNARVDPRTTRTFLVRNAAAAARPGPDPRRYPAKVALASDNVAVGGAAASVQPDP